MPVNVNNFGAIGTNFLNDTFSEAKTEIRVSQLLTPQDGQGGYTKIWELVAIVNGFLIQSSGNEPFDGERLVTTNMVKIHIEPLEGLNEKMRLTINGDYYRILRINNLVNVNQWYIIEAVKGFEE